MTFLDPVPALIAGAVAVPALIALYFLKLRRKPLKVSSTLLWEQAFSDLQANVPLRWLKVSWPLVLQLAALVCLLLAFARPTVSGGAGAARRVVIVIDRSASMSAGDGRLAAAAGEPARTRLDEAKDAALKLIDELRRGGGGAGRPAAMVVELGASPRVLC
ncbi:MAG: VWA domain-containing protein, partial [Phycisphaerales bacterium]|nr:VWA domain-containing protein [Phycisphaerales bacterium]